MDLDVLKSIVAVAETGSFSKAGTRLCVSQSAVSKRIRLLEDTLGMQLLDRSGQQLALTAAGKVVEKSARAMLEICSRCTMELAALRGAVKIDFRCTPSFGISTMPAVTRLLMEQNPELVTVSIANLSSIVDALLDSRCQLAVVEYCDLNPLSHDFRQEPLQGDSLVFVGAPALGIQSAGVGFDDLLTQPLFIRSSGCCSRQVLESRLEDGGCRLQSFANVLICDDLNMIVRSLLAGCGIGYLVRGVVADQIESGLLREYDLPQFRQTIKRSLLYGPSFVETRESLDLVNIIRSLVGSPLGLTQGAVSTRLFQAVPF